MEILNDRKYSPKHTWAKLDGEYAKVASELFAPLSGEVVEANDEKLEDEPEYVNEAPYDAWICKIKVADMAEYEALLTAEQYEASLAE